MRTSEEFDTLTKRARSLLDEGDLEGGLKCAALAVQRGEALWGAVAPELVTPLWLLAKAHHLRAWDAPESVAEQIGILQRAREIASGAQGVDGVDRRVRLALLSSLGDLLLAAGRHAESEQALAAALALAEGDPPASRAFHLTAYVDALYEGGHFERARQVAAELLAMGELEDVPSVFTFGAWYQLGRSLLALGRPHEAAEYFQRCVDHREARHPGSPKNQEFLDLLATAREADSREVGTAH